MSDRPLRLPIMLIALTFALYLLFVSKCSAADAYHWRRIVYASNVQTTVFVVTREEIDRVRAKYGKFEFRNIRSQEKGFSVLHGYNGGRDWRCEIYVTAEASQDTIAHEHKHCEGWGH